MDPAVQKVATLGVPAIGRGRGLSEGSELQGRLVRRRELGNRDPGDRRGGPDISW